MLIRFKVANFLSFKEETEFSMVAGRERLHPNHIIKGGKNQPNLLRSALLYGANAAGKSNFVKAIDHVRQLVILNPEVPLGNLEIQNKAYLIAQEIFDKKFKLDKKYLKRPTSFIFEFISNGKIYEYGFKFIHATILEEWLIEQKQHSETLLFRRKSKSINEVEFDQTSYLTNKSDKDFLGFVQRSVSHSKLFLTHSFENNVQWFRDAFCWFRDSLRIVFPDTKDYEVGKKLNNDNHFKDYFINVMSKTGTGITSVELKKNENERSFRKIGRNQITNDFVNIQLVHNKTSTFTEEEESDGTQRLFDLASPFYDLATSKPPKVYIIDELERNLHTNLSYMLLKSYLEQEGKGQLIATTHDTHLLDLDLLRRDEIWFAEKDEHGATRLYSLYDFNPRYDKDVEKDYLLGRYGAIPFLGNLEFKKKLGKNGNSKNNGEK